jgi:hypothetical protein
MRILLAIDDSKYSQAAADLVVRQMRAEGAEVCVFHALAPLVAGCLPVVVGAPDGGSPRVLRARARRQRWQVRGIDDGTN